MASRHTFEFRTILDTETPFKMSYAMDQMDPIISNINLEMRMGNSDMGSYLEGHWDGASEHYMSGEIEYDAIFYSILIAKVNTHFTKSLEKLGLERAIEVCCKGSKIMIRYYDYQQVDLYRKALLKEVDGLDEDRNGE